MQAGSGAGSVLESGFGVSMLALRVETQSFEMFNFDLKKHSEQRSL